MLKKPFRLTSEGVEELRQELASLMTERTAIADRIKTAREFGDLSENAEYQSAKADQEKNESRISEIEHILHNVEIIKSPKSDSKVQLGSKVTLRNNGTNKVFQITGTVEADPLAGKISDESPVGQLLIGHRVGDKVELQTPVDKAVYEIAEIA